MKKYKKLWIGLGLALIMVGSSALSARAVEFLYKTANGAEFYRCGRPGLVGRAKVTRVHFGEYRVIGPYFMGRVTSSSPIQAAKKACGELRQKR